MNICRARELAREILRGLHGYRQPECQLVLTRLRIGPTSGVSRTQDAELSEKLASFMKETHDECRGRPSPR